MLPNNDLALSYIQELIECSCSSDPPCVTANCGCKKAGIPCSVFCVCKITDCYRAQTHGDDDDDHGGMMKMMMTTKLHIQTFAYISSDIYGFWKNAHKKKKEVLNGVKVPSYKFEVSYT